MPRAIGFYFWQKFLFEYTTHAFHSQIWGQWWMLDYRETTKSNVNVVFIKGSEKNNKIEKSKLKSLVVLRWGDAIFMQFWEIISHIIAGDLLEILIEILNSNR